MGVGNTKTPTYRSQIFTGKVVEQKDGNNKIALNYVSQYQMFVNNMKNGDNATIEVTDKKPLRTKQQNNYLWLFYSLISLSSGHTTDELHEWATDEFLLKGITEVFGKTVRVVNSTTKLNKWEFCEFICRIEDATGIESPVTEPFLNYLTESEYQKLKAEQMRFYERMKSKIFMKT